MLASVIDSYFAEINQKTNLLQHQSNNILQVVPSHSTAAFISERPCTSGTLGPEGEPENDSLPHRLNGHSLTFHQRRVPGSSFHPGPDNLGIPLVLLDFYKGKVRTHRGKFQTMDHIPKSGCSLDGWN